MFPLIVGVFLLASTTTIGSTTTYNSVYPATTTPISSSTILSLIRAYSAYYDVSYDEMYHTISCESNFKQYAVSPTNDYGIVQINLSSWNISKELAFDANFSIAFMAQQFSLHHEYYWVCWKNLYGKT